MFLDYLGIMTVFNLDNYSVLIHTKNNLPQRQDIHIHNSKNSNKPNVTEPEPGQSCESSDLTEKPQKYMKYILYFVGKCIQIAVYLHTKKDKQTLL